jgi:mannitol-1-phosphate 5-dehydrogenase
VRAVVFGPGRIGCGYVGERLSAAGYQLTFVGRGAALESLARHRRYRVRLTDGRRSSEQEIAVAGALQASDAEAVAAAVAEADLVAVSVGADNLGSIAPLLAKGLLARQTPVDVIAFENCADPGERLRSEVLRAAPALHSAGHGFAGGLVSRIVSQRLGDPAGDQPVRFLGDPAAACVIHGPSLRTRLPAIEGFRLVDDFAAFVTKKLFTFSAGHAAAAYLGALKGYRYVHTAVRDPEIRAEVLAAMEEGRRGLLRRYGPEIAGDASELTAILARFENASLNDPVERVGRDPLRKLGRNDRLVGAARLAEAAGVRPKRLALVAAAALCFLALHGGGAAGRLDATLLEVAGVDPRSALGRDVADAFASLGGQERGSVLLSLRERRWSWARDSQMAAAA